MNLRTGFKLKHNIFKLKKALIIEYLHRHSYRRIPNTFASSQICIHMFLSSGLDYFNPFHPRNIISDKRF